MQHYFGTIVGDSAIIDGNQTHHLLDVRRARIGEKIEVSDGVNSFLCEIERLDPLAVKVIRALEDKRELDIDVTLAFAVLKGDHNDLIVLKGTELGVSKFIPFLSERVVVTPEKGEDNRLRRLRKKAEEGAMQCRRDVVPEVTDYKNYDQILDGDYDYKFFAYEGVAIEGETFYEAVKDRLALHNRVLLLIGPEGGFTDEEAKKAKEHGFLAVSLGKRILRAETAAIYGASVLAALSEAL